MSGLSSIYNLENESMKESFLHLMDGRVKLVILIFMIVYAVYTTEILVLAIMEIYLLILIYLSKISFKGAIKRLLLLLPFGGAIVVFQPFIHPGTVMYVLPFGINVTYEGLAFGLLLFSRLLVTLTAIVLLSSISPMQEVVQSFRKLGMPKEFSMLLGLMIRFLFVFFDELQKIRNAQTSRNFNIFNKRTTYMWRMKQIGYTVMMMFLRSYEQGEKVYASMVSRGYSDDSQMYTTKEKIGQKEYTFIIVTIAMVISIEVMKYASFI